MADRLRSFVRDEQVSFERSGGMLMDSVAEGRNKTGDKASWVSIRRRRNSEVANASSSSLELIRRGPSAACSTNYTSHALIPLHPLTILPRIRPPDWMLGHLEGGGTSRLVKDEMNRKFHIEPPTKTLERGSPSPLGLAEAQQTKETGPELEHRCPVAEPRMSPSPSQAQLPSQCHEDGRPLVKLEDIWLWRKFSSSFPESGQSLEGLQCNEMIITKHGRCLFPTLRYSIKGLSPSETYSVGIEMRELRHGSKFKFRQGKWCPKEESRPLEELRQSPSLDAKDERAVERVAWSAASIMLRHPEGCKSGEFWMSQGIGFSKLKLTNRKSNLPSSMGLSNVPLKERVRKSSHGRASPKLTKSSYSSSLVYRLSSFHYYEPILHIFHHEQKREREREHDQKQEREHDQKQEREHDQEREREQKHWEIGFPESRFIAVTHYQNQWINHLKKNYNPHAKGFKEGGEEMTEDDDDDDDEKDEQIRDLEHEHKQGRDQGQESGTQQRVKGQDMRRTGIQTPQMGPTSELGGYEEQQRQKRKRNTILLPVKKLLRPDMSSDWTVKEIEAIQLLSFWSDHKQAE